MVSAIFKNYLFMDTSVCLLIHWAYIDLVLFPGIVVGVGYMAVTKTEKYLPSLNFQSCEERDNQ